MKEEKTNDTYAGYTEEECEEAYNSQTPEEQLVSQYLVEMILAAEEQRIYGNRLQDTFCD